MRKSVLGGGIMHSSVGGNVSVSGVGGLNSNMSRSVSGDVVCAGASVGAAA